MEELIKKWKELNEKAHKVLGEGKSFRSYNNIRLKMDEIEKDLINKYDIDIDKILYNG